MKQGENEVAKQTWEPMKLTCVGHIGEVVAEGEPAPPAPAVQQATPPFVLLTQ